MKFASFYLIQFVEIGLTLCLLTNHQKSLYYKLISYLSKVLHEFEMRDSKLQIFKVSSAKCTYEAPLKS